MTSAHSRSWAGATGSTLLAPFRALVGVARAALRKLSGSEVEGAPPSANEVLTPRATRLLRRLSLVQVTPPLYPLGCAFTPRARGTHAPLSPLRPLLLDSPPPSPVAPRALWEHHEASDKSADVCDVPAGRVETSEDFWQVQLDAIYQRRNPYKRLRIPALLSKYRGHEVLLYRKVCKQYHLDPTRFYEDSAAWPSEEEDDVDMYAPETLAGKASAVATVGAPSATCLGAARTPPVAPSIGNPFDFRFKAGSAVFNSWVRPVPVVTEGSAQEQQRSVEQHCAAAAVKVVVSPCPLAVAVRPPAESQRLLEEPSAPRATEHRVFAAAPPRTLLPPSGRSEETRARSTDRRIFADVPLRPLTRPPTAPSPAARSATSSVGARALDRPAESQASSTVYAPRREALAQEPPTTPLERPLERALRPRRDEGGSVGRVSAAAAAWEARAPKRKHGDDTPLGRVAASAAAWEERAAKAARTTGPTPPRPGATPQRARVP